MAVRVCMDELKYMNYEVYNTINNVVGFTVTFRDRVVFPICDRTSDRSRFVQFRTILTIGSRTALLCLLF